MAGHNSQNHVYIIEENGLKRCRIRKERMENLYKNYFDYAASAPPYEEALKIYTQTAGELFANPSSAHKKGAAAQRELAKGKNKLADLLGFSGGSAILTSGGTEANNLAIRGVMEKHPNGRLLIGGDVHASVWFAQKLYPRRVDILPLNNRGEIEEKTFLKKLNSKTVLCSLILGNNETGIIQDINFPGNECRKRGILFHIDGVQAAGHIPLNLENLPFDFFSLSFHKWGGIRGSGALLIRSDRLQPQLYGGSQEMGFRGGTENTAALKASVTALDLRLRHLDAETQKLRDLEELFLKVLRKNINNFTLNSKPGRGLPGLLSLSFKGIQSSSLVAELNLLGYCLSAGSACHAGDIRPSRVIQAMGRNTKLASGSIRISMGNFTSTEEVSSLAETLSRILKERGLQ